MAATVKIQAKVGKFFILTIALAAIGLAITPIGTDPWRRAWLSGITIVAGGIMIISTFRYPYREGLPFVDIFCILIFFLVVFSISSAIEYTFAGGDAFHSYRGFPFRWLVGNLNIDMSTTYEWSIFWPGLLVDGFCWFTVALGLTLLIRQLRILLKNPDR